jgi:hypothetical protein
MHGRATDGCYSIVLSGGYEDDEDNGDEFVYTGAGGRDLKGNKRHFVVCVFFCNCVKIQCSVERSGIGKNKSCFSFELFWA